LEVVGIEGVPLEYRIILRDKDLHRDVDLRALSDYRFFHLGRDPGAPGETRFDLLIGNDDFVASDPNRPSVFRMRLLGAHPNPFRSGAVIRYEVDRPGNVEIDIFDVQGRRVRRLLADAPEPGRFEVAWRGEGDDGRVASPGVYFYRLRSPVISEARKLVRIG
jgi:hypothetical protein